MLKWFFVGTCTLAPLLTSTDVYAQANRLITPSAEPPTASADTGIAPLELQQYVQALKQIQAIEMQTQQKMGQVIQGEGLSVERFIEIDRAASTGNAPTTSPISEKEQQQYNSAVTKIQKVWQESQPKKERAIAGQGLNPRRFSQINAQVQRDQVLQQKVKQMMGGASDPRTGGVAEQGK
jgi:hypothetical protein